MREVELECGNERNVARANRSATSTRAITVPNMPHFSAWRHRDRDSVLLDIGRELVELLAISISLANYKRDWS